MSPFTRESPELVRAAALLAEGTGIVVLTGAGISAESGVPTFRGPGGLWKSFRPEELATPAAFARDPQLVWEWYGWRRSLLSRCEPNAAHAALAAWSSSRSDVQLVTQNVDDLHERAMSAVASGRGAVPLHLHGSIFRARCTACNVELAHDDEVDASTAAALPRCECGGLLRPAVVWFGEPLDERALGDALVAASQASVCLVIGTSGQVQPAASLASVAHSAGGAVVEVNLEPTLLTPIAEVALHGPAAEIVPVLLGSASR